MHKLGFFIFCICFSLNVIQALSQKCSQDTKCLLLKECPEMLRFFRTRLGILRVTQSHCGFEGPHSKVCCPIRKRNVLSSSPNENVDSSDPEKPPFDQKDYFPTNCGLPGVTDRIHGGIKASLGAYPWVAAFEYEDETKEPKTKILCAGSLINKRYILTAAHCFDEKDIGNYKLKRIRLGEAHLSTDPDCVNTLVGETCAPPLTEVIPDTVSVHPQYDINFRYSHDIALVRLSRTIEFTRYVQPICIPPSNINIKRAVGNRSAIVAGWGYTETSNTISEYLREVSLPLQDNSVCRRIYPNQYSNYQLCAGGIEGKDSCIGDSGAPLVVAGPFSPPYLQLGIVSFGPQTCGLANVPAVYTSVKNFASWIKDTMKPW